MERFDYYDILPKGMDAYLASHGHHFSRPMLEWAVGMMRDRDGNKLVVVERKTLDGILAKYDVELKRNEGYYDPIYVWNMGLADYYGSSVPDEQHLALFVKNYIDDKDGNPTRAFDEFYINTAAKGIDFPWEDLI